MKGLAARLRKAELIANPLTGCHIIFVPDDVAALEGDAFERWKAAATRDTPPAATVVFVQFRAPGEPPCTNDMIRPEQLWPLGSLSGGGSAHEPQVQ
jgi:hypothetical protein